MSPVVHSLSNPKRVVFLLLLLLGAIALYQPTRRYLPAKEAEKEVRNHLHRAAANLSRCDLQSKAGERNACEAAIQEYRRVLALDPNNLTAIESLGSLLATMASEPFDQTLFEEARAYHKRHSAVASDNPNPYYWVGYINWRLAFLANNEMRTRYNQTAAKPVGPFEPLPPSVQAHFVALYSATVEEGIEHMYKAVELKPDYASAYAYLNLHYRLKADMVTAGERESLLNKADDFVKKYKELKQKELERAQNPPEPKP